MHEMQYMCYDSILHELSARVKGRVREDCTDVCVLLHDHFFRLVSLWFSARALNLCLAVGYFEFILFC